MSKSARKPKTWGGRFAEPTADFVERFTASVHFDCRLWRHDIEASRVHARMLQRAGLLSEAEQRELDAGLAAIGEQIEKGEFHWDPQLEDVHTNIEAALVERCGDVGKKLHTARSRNDQVATDLRLYLRDVIAELDAGLHTLQQALLDLAEREADTVMPGCTHLQPAQPVSFGHHVLAWHAMLQRDRERFADCRQRVDVCPLGAAALAGAPYPIDPEFTARELGFARAFDNSLDAVSDRDFAIEFCACAALLMMHFSRIAEELILWNSPQFGFVSLPDRFCTGSSIMPQKKNPDVPELVRGKSGRVYGDLHALLTLMKAQPLAYNRDNQEDKEALFDAADTTLACLEALCGLVPGLEVDAQRLREAAGRGFSLATDLADYLVQKGLPFRDAHELTGQVVQRAMERGVELQELSLEELQACSPLIEAEILERLSPEASLAARAHAGATAPGQVRDAVRRARLETASAAGRSGTRRTRRKPSPGGSDQ